MFEQFIKQLATTSWVEWLGMVTGILGVWLSIKEKVAAWPLFIACYCSYAYISYLYRLQAFMGMNIVFVGISIYGWLKWTRKLDGATTELAVSHTKTSHWPLVIFFILASTGGLGWLLSINGEAKLPYLDALATSCAFTAQWMLSRKHIETWIFWIISNAVYLCIFAGGQHWPSVILFAVFIGLAIKGWREWKLLLS